MQPEPGSSADILILGPLEVAIDGRALDLGSLRQRALLALLVTRSSEPVTADELVDALWGERPPASAAHAIHVYVSGIRKALREARGVVLRSASSSYSVEVDRERIDAARFEELIVDGQRALEQQPAAARDRFERALALWRGRPLADLERFDFAVSEAARLQELRATADEGMLESRLRAGEDAELVWALTAQVEAEPLRERPRRLLMLALYRAGRHADALSAYHDAVVALDELGLQPGPDLRDLEQAILRHDPKLCVQPMTPPPVPEPIQPTLTVKRRKVVTALFCDVTGSTKLGEELDPETLHGVMQRYWRELRAVIERHGGTVDKFIGDAVMAVFGIPQVHEDDALRAVRAAAEIRGRIPTVASEIGVRLTFRTAVNTGLVVVGESENLAIGDAINVAARLEQAAAPGEILLGEETVHLVRDAVRVQPLEPLMLKGKSVPVQAFRLLEVDPRAPGHSRDGGTQLVGRDRELEALSAAWRRTVDMAGCHLFTLLGLAGVGKSRLLAELFASIGDSATVLSGRCLSYGEAITFWPLLEAFAPISGQAERILEQLGHGGAGSAEELFFEVRRLIESLAADRPLVLHVDDLQWAEPMMLDLLDHLVDLSRGAPILLICTARPELLERRPGWSGGKLNATTFLLEPLDRAACEVLLSQIADGLAAETRTSIIQTSEGNPLFLEEIAALARTGETLSVPPTIQALLAARLEQLPEDERELLERAAIEGEVFHRAPLAALLAHLPAAALDARLTTLIRKELIRPHAATLEGERAFRFRHLLTREAAYDSLPKASRADLHERFATWLETHVHEMAGLDEIAGWHLEQAIGYHRAIGGEVPALLASRAAQHLHAAGRRARERGDPAAARGLLSRAQSLVPLDGDELARIQVDLADELVEAGELDRADQLLSAPLIDPDALPSAALVRLQWLLAADQQQALRTIPARLPDLFRRLSEAREYRELAKAHMIAFQLGWISGGTTAPAEHALQAARYARAAGEEGLRAQALAWYVSCLAWGPENVDAIRKHLDAIEADVPGPYLAGRVISVRGRLARFEGRIHEAKQLAQRAIDVQLELGLHVNAAEGLSKLAELARLEGDLAAALRLLSTSDAELAELGEQGYRSTTQAHLAGVHEAMGNRVAARRAADLAEELGGPDDALTIMIVRGVRARLALAEGDLAGALAHGRAGVEVAAGTEWPVHQGSARLELASILVACGDQQGAASEARTALALFEAKGDALDAARAVAILEGLGSGERRV